MNSITTLAKLVAKEDDFGYITYVFEVLEDKLLPYTKYIMCTQFPNWNHRSIEIGEIGYLDFTELRAGVTEWYDGERMHKHCYNNNQFIRFIEKPKDEHYEYTM